jgi:DNA-directed RNA polymerase sigma subunit (sigma70/sigma32)
MAIRIKSQATRRDFCRFSSYGFDGNMLRDVGEHIGLTREIVRQIQLKELNCL